MDNSFHERCEDLKVALGPGFQHYHEDLETLEKLRRAGFQRPVIYDIGASNTVWSVVAHKIFPDCRIEMFEPLAELSDRYAKGKLTHPKVVAFLENADQATHPIVLGSSNGTCRFCRMSDESASTSLNGGFPTGSAEFVDLPMHRLDDYAFLRGLQPADIIKLDTQGSEIDILRGAAAVLASAKAVFVESWLTKGYGPQTPLLLEMTEFLSRYGFLLADLSGEHRTPGNILNAKDALYLKYLPGPLQLNAEEISGESAFSRLANSGFTADKVLVCADRPEVWRAEAERVFPRVTVNIGNIEMLRQPAKENPAHEILVLDHRPDLIRTAIEFLHPGMAVVARIRTDSQVEASEQPFLVVGKMMAQRDLHLFDVGRCSRSSSSGFLQWADVVFLGRSANVSPLRTVWPGSLYRIPGLGSELVSCKDYARLFYSMARQWLAKCLPAK